MTAERWQQLKELYAEAEPLDDAELEAFLASAAADPALADELRLLLAAGKSEGFLDRPLQILDETVPLSARPAFVPGELLCDRFEVVRFIARGGMGEVYEAQDTELQERVAVKTVRASARSDAHSTELFRQEVRRARTITSQHVCRVHDLFTHRGVSRPPVLFFSMRLLDGETLAKRIQREGKMEPAAVLPLLRQIADGVDAAHLKHIVHGDLKSANVMLAPDDAGSVTACITDFGLAQRFAAEQEESTGDGLARGGTPAWMAPEQIEGKPLGPEADIYAFGLIAYEMITGRLPFDGPTPEAVALQRLSKSPRPARDFVPDLPAAWEHALARCLERDPAKRFPTAASFVAAIASAAPAKSPIHRLILVLAILLAGGAGVTAAVQWQPIRQWIAVRRPASQDRSVAVLPFQHIGQTPEYFSDGVTEELMHALGQVKGLRVLGPESSFHFKSSKLTLREIGRKLDVRYLLNGSVRRVDHEIRIITRLVDASTGVQVWSRDFTRNERDLLLIRDDIVRMLSSELQLQLADMQSPALPLDAAGLGAHDLYWTGRLYFRQRTDESVRASLDYFRQSVARDPSFALGYSGLADALFVLAERALIPPDEAITEGRKAARKAIELDGRLSEAWLALAQVTSVHDRDLEKAEVLFRRALELDSKSSPALQWYSYQLAKQRRFAEAVQAGEAAVAADPLSMPSNINLADMYFYAGLDDRTVQQCRKLMQMAPNLFFDHLLVAVVFAKKGLLSEALHEMESIPAARTEHPWTLRVWVEIYAIAGLRQQAEEALERLLTRYRQGGVQASYIATAYAALGDKERALEWLTKAVDQHDASASFASAYPAFDYIRSDPRFVVLMARLGIKAQIA